ncbi:MAG: HAMP domain-containing protein [Acidobacteria bacterium]|nr:HAMP domain-containing protein [Acidobacteriota bacterium]MBI3423269.1 HAMP domain-containing protein [Acidobacteriota bacterium]
MRTSTRLILILTVLVGLIMAAGGYYRLRQRETFLQRMLQNEMHAQALTLQIALENVFRAGRPQEAQLLIDSLSQNPKVFGVLVFDETGTAVLASSSMTAENRQQNEAARSVATTGIPTERTRRFNNEEVASLLTPLSLGAARRGAFELAQPTSFIKTELALARRDITVVTLLVFAAILLAVLAVMRYSLVQPIRALVRGAAALGRGDLNYRVPEPRQGSELAQLAREFNRMADSLAEQRQTAEREAERRLKLERELRDTERLAAVGRLAAGVAHEIGTPLNVIDARAEQLLERVDAPLPIRQRNLTIIRGQIERITRIVRQLLNLARPYQLHRTPTAAGPLVAGVVELLEADAARQQIELVIHKVENVLFDIDSELIHQVLLNVCQNGLHAMPDGGRLLIACAGPLLLRNGQRFASISVRDTGTGIAPEHLMHLFDPFFTTKDIGNGTGLGLAVSRRIVEEHGGWITATNNATRGAQFTLYLPVAKEAVAEAATVAEVPGTKELQPSAGIKQRKPREQAAQAPQPV